MSKESVLTFLSRASEDPGLLERIQSAGTDLNAILAIAAESGYRFTIAELQTAIKEMQSEVEELSDEQLNQVVGGASQQSLHATTGNGLSVCCTQIPAYGGGCRKCCVVIRLG
jgi:predicted ribosomally synthesized peptide with nif11-like leader